MAQTTTNHDTIRKWVEGRGGRPAHVKRTADANDPGVLRIDFPGYSGEDTLETISWDRWFRWFDENELVFLHEEEKDSRFNKLISRTSERGD